MRQKGTGPSVLSAEELSVFCYQLSLMMGAGIGPEESISIMELEAHVPEERELLEGMHRVLMQGAPFVQALERAGCFPDYMLRMIEIGQASGRLDQVFSALSDYYRKEADTQRSLSRAIAYPAVMGVLIMVIFLALVSQVLPVFQQVFDQLGVSLSPVAYGLLRVGTASKYVAGVFAAVLTACALCALWLLRTEGGRAWVSRLLGGTAPAKFLNRSRFASAMALMLSSGLPLDEAMNRACTLLHGSKLTPALEQCREEMEQGVAFPNAVEKCGIFSGLQANLLGAGFRTGVSERAMHELADRCQVEADENLMVLRSRFEYSLVIALCTAVGLVLLSVMMPLLGVLSAIGG